MCIVPDGWIPLNIRTIIPYYLQSKFIIENINVKLDEEYAFNILYHPSFIEFTNRNLNVKPASADSSVIDISYDDTNPMRAKDFLSHLTSGYIKQNIEIMLINILAKY